MNSKKNNNPQFETAESDPVLAQFRRYQAVLADTGSSIPKLLGEQHELRRQLGSTEIEGGDIQRLRERLDTIANALASAGRQRAAASEGLLAMSGELREARAAMAQELAEMARSTVTDFTSRWNRAVAELSRLHAEAAVLSRALRTTVATVPPYSATLSADGTRMQVAFSGPIEVDTVTLPSEVAAITERLDELDAAMALCSAIGQAREWDQRHSAMQRSRAGSMPVMSGMYTVIRAFDHMGRRFQVGELIDETLMGRGILHRRWMARELQPVASAA